MTNGNEISGHDANLIAKAEKSTDWWQVSRLEDEANSEAGKRELHIIATRMFHNEEYSGGAL